MLVVPLLLVGAVAQPLRLLGRLPVLPRARWSCFLAKPDTLLRWHRRLIAGIWS